MRQNDIYPLPRHGHLLAGMPMKALVLASVFGMFAGYPAQAGGSPGGVVNLGAKAQAGKTEGAGGGTEPAGAKPGVAGGVAGGMEPTGRKPGVISGGTEPAGSKPSVAVGGS